MGGIGMTHGHFVLIMLYSLSLKKVGCFLFPFFGRNLSFGIIFLNKSLQTV